jgi:hypothetical protein
MVSKAQKIRRGKAASAKAAKAARPSVHPVVRQAGVTAEQSARARFEAAAVPNPLRTVDAIGQPLVHLACRRVPHYETLYRSKVIDRYAFAALEWYADRLALAHSGLFKCGLDTAGSGGGSSASHVPSSAAAVGARSDIDWARQFIPAALREVFDAVMVDGLSFVESARRLAAGRYVRASVRTQRREIGAQFVAAAVALSAGVLPRIVNTQSRIVSS